MIKKDNKYHIIVISLTLMSVILMSTVNILFGIIGLVVILFDNITNVINYHKTKNNIDNIDNIDTEVEEYVFHNPLTLPEFMSIYDSEDGETPNAEWSRHWNKYISTFLDNPETLIHQGDCTKVPTRCTLCFLEDSLREYREYIFNGKLPE